MALYGGGTSTTLSVWTSWIKAYTYSRDDVQYGFFIFFALFLISLLGPPSELSVPVGGVHANKHILRFRTIYRLLIGKITAIFTSTIGPLANSLLRRAFICLLPSNTYVLTACGWAIGAQGGLLLARDQLGAFQLWGGLHRTAHLT